MWHRRFTTIAGASTLFLITCAYFLADWVGREASVEAHASLASRLQLAALAVGLALAAAYVLMLRRSAAKLRKLANDLAALAEGQCDRPIANLATEGIGSLERLLDQLRRKLRDSAADMDRAERDFRVMLETLPEGVVAVDQDHRIAFANRAIYRLFDLSAGRNVTGERMWEVLRSAALTESAEAVQATGDEVIKEFRDSAADRLFSLRAAPLDVRGGRGVLIVLHDVTELRRLERIRQEFVANASHELKTPVSSIKAYAETLLADESLDAETRQRFLARIEEQADRLTAIVHDMLALARLDSGEEVFNFEPVDVHDVLVGCVDGFHKAATQQNVELRLQSASTGIRVRADAEGLAAVVNNLLDNAIRYTPAGGSVTVTSALRNGRAVIEVCDTGVGISPVDQKRIFERFYRVDPARSRGRGGTGLGLAIVKHTVHAFGGAVGVQSRLGTGSAFTVELPLEQTGTKFVCATAPSDSPDMPAGAAAGRFAQSGCAQTGNSEFIQVPT
jgi:two-component system phosphate regulon sensor histidine kinase PhoR